MFIHPKSHLSEHLNPVESKLWLFPAPHHILPQRASSPATLLLSLSLAMPRRHTPEPSVELSADSAFKICDSLLRMSSFLMVQLPEDELRSIRDLLDTLTTRADHLLDAAGADVSFHFNGLAIDHDLGIGPESIRQPWSEDFGAILVSTSSTVSSTSPTPTPAPTPTLVNTPAPMHGRYPLIVSTRRFVGCPDYTHHPEFVRPGVPGPYFVPPTATGVTDRAVYYVVSKGLYVGIFFDWHECRPWVTGVSGSIHQKFPSWEYARRLYNSRLAADSIEVLS
ncbi:hypothetical protein BJ322DRAFT_1113001 [Thelephora terrestris]|uniref:Ribonuclease H1 N-terminal domain-containing protein n=1 Tax=Thelephora terrestris TaxID=56493 RepID=A0A9P6H7C0_9AGAM|nr:hypothetical protein BJ322DRAFT_1113001 [Thelephora terrestris]